MKSTVLLILVLVTTTAIYGQSTNAFSFKGNALGTSLQDFRALPSNRAAIWINTGEPSKKLDKRKSLEVSTPLCSDQYGGISPKDLHSGEIACLTGTAGHYSMSFKKGNHQREGGINEQSLLVAGHDPEAVWYYFYEERLYKIEIGRFIPGDFADILDAFVEKLGVPTQITKADYQNGFGAKWQSSTVVWREGEKTITVEEGPGNGPGQDSFNRVVGPTILFLDEAVAKKLSPSGPTKVDF